MYFIPISIKDSVKGLAFNNHGRVWIPTCIWQPVKDERSMDNSPADLIIVEVYNQDGVLPCKILFNVFFYTIRIFGSYIFC